IVGDITKMETLSPEYFKGVKKVINAASVIIGPKEGDTPDRAKYSQGIKFFEPEDYRMENCYLDSKNHTCDMALLCRFVHVSSAGVTRPGRPGLDLSKQPPAVRLNKELGFVLTYKLKVTSLNLSIIIFSLYSCIPDYAQAKELKVS
ncbi:hypothetical protein BHE74_00011313, partial [Ensete ventricosum]